MRWFVALLLVANVILFFWVQQQSRPTPGTVSLPPPDVGRLRLMSEIDNQVPTEEDSGAPGTLAASPEPSVETDARETAVQEGPAMQQVEAHAAESPASQRASGTVVTARRATEAPPSDNRPEQTPSQDTSDAAVS